MTTEDPRTFGAAIAEKRKELGLSQKQLAEKIQREEGGSISPQYLNDIEHDRRSPSSDHIIGEFARVLSLSPNYLYFLAGRVPAELRKRNVTEYQVEKFLAAAFRRSTSDNKR